MFPQLGAPVGLFVSILAFLLISNALNETQLFSWGQRLPLCLPACWWESLCTFACNSHNTGLQTQSGSAIKQMRVPFAAVVAAATVGLLLGALAASTAPLSVFTWPMYSQAGQATAF